MLTLSENEFRFSSESVTEGHPDKLADAVLTGDRGGWMACETLVSTVLILFSGEITTDAYVHIPKIARQTAVRPKLKDAPRGSVLSVRDVRAPVGAGFIYPICGDMRTVPGPTSHPAAERIGIDEHGAGGRW